MLSGNFTCPGLLQCGKETQVHGVGWACGFLRLTRAPASADFLSSFPSCCEEGGKLAKHGEINQSLVFTQIALKCELPFFLICQFPILCYDSGSVNGEGKSGWVMKSCTNTEEGNVCLHVFTGVAGLFQSGPSSKQEACSARWRRWKDISLNVSKNPSGGWSLITTQHFCASET